MLLRSVPRFVSKFRSAEAIATDAFSLDWSNERGWANPPWGLLPRVLAKIRAERAATIVVAPMWLSAPWWPDFRELANDDMIIIPPARTNFLPGHLASVEPLGSPHWATAVALLNGGVVV